MTKLKLMAGVFTLVLFSACNKVEGGKIKQGDYVGTLTVYADGSPVYNMGAEIDLEKNTFDVELTPNMEMKIEGEGGFSATKNDITFNLVTPAFHEALPKGTYTYTLSNKGENLMLSKVENNMRYDFNLVLKKD